MENNPTKEHTMNTTTRTFGNGMAHAETTSFDLLITLAFFDGGDRAVVAVSDRRFLGSADTWDGVGPAALVQGF